MLRWLPNFSCPLLVRLCFWNLDDHYFLCHI
uniref:Uncharacterized protein n=1 Tax=Arundo donax TaxID=35708 RepID=A0A0A9CBI7_ARUDO